MSYYWENHGYEEVKGLRVPKPYGFSKVFFRDMTWKKVRKDSEYSKCRNCEHPIRKGDWAFGNTWSRLCRVCGKKFCENTSAHFQLASNYFQNIINYVENKEQEKENEERIAKEK